MSCPSAYYCHFWRIYQYVVIAILNSTFVLSVGRDYTALCVTQPNISRRLAPKPLKRAVHVGTGLGAELILITHTDGVAGVWFTPALACLYQHDMSKTAAAGINKLDIQMFHDESLKPVYFAVKKSRSRVTITSFLHSCECWRLVLPCC